MFFVATNFQELIVLGGMDAADLGLAPEAWDYLSKSPCNTPSYFDFTAREGLDDGVYEGMVCDYVHERSICCGGEFGANAGRWLAQDDCGYLEGNSWISFDEMPNELVFPSAAPVTIDCANYWLVSGGESKLDSIFTKQNIFTSFPSDHLMEPQTAMYLLDESLTWSTFEFELPVPMVAHCTVQIDENMIAFIGGVTDASNVKKADRINSIFIWNDGEWEYGPE